MPRTTTGAPKTTDATGFTPIRITAKKTKTKDPGVPLFYLGDVEYRVPAKPPSSAVLEFVRLSREEGEMVAAQRVLERLLGPEAYKAVEQSDDLEPEDLEQILRALIQHLAGPPEAGTDPQ
jgi:hypothetical protein